MLAMHLLPWPPARREGCRTVFMLPGVATDTFAVGEARDHAAGKRWKGHSRLPCSLTHCARSSKRPTPCPSPMQCADGPTHRRKSFSVELPRRVRQSRLVYIESRACRPHGQPTHRHPPSRSACPPSGAAVAALSAAQLRVIRSSSPRPGRSCSLPRPRSSQSQIAQRRGTGCRSAHAHTKPEVQAHA